jgi:hypothetical protein
VPVLRQIESYRGRCAQERAAIGSEAMAVAMERGVAGDSMRQHDWRDLLKLAGAGERDKSSAGAASRYAGCLFGAYGEKLRVSATLSPDEIAGQRIVQGLGNVCASERATAEQAAGSQHLQEYNDLRLYKGLADNNGDRASMARLEQGLAHISGGEPAERASMNYMHCLAQARLNQMDGGSASAPQTAQDTSLRGGGRESGAHEPDRPGTVIASAPQNPNPKQSGDKNYLTEDGKPCITAQAMPTEVHDDGWRNYTMEYTNVCPRIIVIYSRWIQDGPLWNTDGVQSGGIGEGSKSRPAKMGANCVNDPKHKANACAGYSEWWVR